MKAQIEVLQPAFALEAAFEVVLKRAPLPRANAALPPVTSESQLLPLMQQPLEARGIPDSALHD